MIEKIDEKPGDTVKIICPDCFTISVIAKRATVPLKGEGYANVGICVVCGCVMIVQVNKVRKATDKEIEEAKQNRTFRIATRAVEMVRDEAKN